MNLSEMKRKKIRRKIGVGEFAVEIYNPSLEERKKILNVLVENYDMQEKQFVITPYDLLNFLIPMLTNVEIDVTDEVLFQEILDDPSDELLDIQEEIQEIVYDITQRFTKALMDLDRVGDDAIQQAMETVIKDE